MRELFGLPFESLNGRPQGREQRLSEEAGDPLREERMNGIGRSETPTQPGNLAHYILSPLGRTRNHLCEEGLY